mmetsp:Transcript_6989/g.17105  ORF Transcript_6989/g.17105 Transcript_6989/m.17105 type:complete len:328 (+) Transcript_6989:183-1166(+)|eukprot:CAMPEP_0114494642 /NCGR_PEP_ID=MMETSP0109-20121206/4764_1 /TAXON_ID=29199 /ORGANISM="Chlorarachnion reptans, Strain CCCM449" /LENGTH=327 /DNA_ID=CAMNT_0001671699 /DNA_START=77 /DNA_END=1060 /DNA_ORIENTATION=-
MAHRGEKLVDLYVLLGIEHDAAPKEIGKAYRKMSLKWHPDRNPKNKELAEEKFDELLKAYEVLKNEKKKKEYDAKLQVQREREAKWEAANAEIRAMREKLEKREREADELRRAKRQKLDEKKLAEKNSKHKVLQECMREILEEEHEKTGLRYGMRRFPSAPSGLFSSKSSNLSNASDRGSVKIKWTKGEVHSSESIRAIFSKYGHIRDIVIKKRGATITFAKKKEAEDSYLHEHENKAFRIKLVKDDTNQANVNQQYDSASNGESTFTSPGHNPFSNIGEETQSKSNGFNKIQNHEEGMDSQPSLNATVGSESLESEDAILARMMSS